MTIFFFFLNTLLDKARSCLNYTLSDCWGISINNPLLLPQSAIIAANSRGQWCAVQRKPVQIQDPAVGTSAPPYSPQRLQLAFCKMGRLTRSFS